MASSLLQLVLCAFPLLYNLHVFIAANNDTDRIALLAIKAKITNDPLNVMSSWNSTLHFCKWHGVTCDSQRVTVVDLQSSKLTGYLSPYIGNLSSLRELKLQNNNFLGTVPPEIGRLQSLRNLLLFNNSLGGEIPPYISHCSSLIQVRLDNNRLVGKIPPEFGSLSKLQVLTLPMNNLSGTIPPSLGNLSSLKALAINQNRLVGSIPNSLGKLKNLTYLSFSLNKLSGVVPQSIFNLLLLEQLDLGDNELEGSLPSYIGTTFTKLWFFSIGNNHFTGTIPASLSNCSNLEILQLNTNNLHGQVPPLHKLEKLNTFTIHENFLGNGQATDLDFVSSLANATMLENFSIAQNNFTGDFPKIVCNFSMLEEFGMGRNMITGEIPDCIANLEAFQWFDASDNQLSGVIPQIMGKLKNLNQLNFGTNQLSGKIPSSIGNLTKLTILYLYDNNLEGQIPSTFGNSTNLLELLLSRNKFSGRIPTEVISLSSLSLGLDLSVNQLTGPLPTEVGRLHNLGALDVSRNMLEGKIPSSLSSCEALEFLYMEGNFFHGAIPPALGALKGLRELDLSGNNLSGDIPKVLESLQLQWLNLSYNNLEGEVPTGGIFSNATVVFISGNSRLCGGRPELKLPHCDFNKIQKRRSRHVKLMIGILSVVLVLILLVVFISVYAFRNRNNRPKEPTISGEEALPNLSYQSLLKATNGFSAENLIGSGAFGAVYRGTLDQDGKIVAIKKLNLDHKGAAKTFMAECGVLRNIRHRNLIKVITVCSGIDYQGNDFKALVYEYMVNGSLEDWLYPESPHTTGGTSYAPKKLNLLQRIHIMVDVAFALEYLHHGCGASAVHCDLKPSNVLLDDEMVAHVGDFGLAKFLSTGISSSHINQTSSVGIRGTVGYAPPEYGMGNEVSTKGDVYSYGILLLEMVTGKRPTDGMFRDGLSLHRFVEAALPHQVTEILDNSLLNQTYREDNNTRGAHNLSNHITALDAVTAVLELALSCSNELPSERMDMQDVTARLSSIRNKLLGAPLH